MSYKTIPIDSWGEFRDLVAGEQYRNWAFRGQKKASWPLFSSLSRHLREFGVHRDAWTPQEERILRIFKRKAHLFLDHIPDENDSFQWLALMQHHGAPTRILDLTWSPYVAAFFALEEATDDVAVWGFHVQTISWSKDVPLAGGQTASPSDITPRQPGNFERYFLPGDLKYVFIGEPYVMNKRLTAQSGTFAMPGVLDTPLEDLITARADLSRSVVKFVLPAKRIRRDAMRELYNVNITNATLFPDLEGLARSMAYEVEFHWAIDPYTNKQMVGYLQP